jgi:hypothetical protein
VAREEGEWARMCDKIRGHTSKMISKQRRTRESKRQVGVEEERGMENKVGGHAHFEVEECGEELESL